MGNVLIACEFSGTVRNEFAKLGHYAMSCDLLPTESEFINSNCAHYTGDIKDILDDKKCVWNLLIAHHRVRISQMPEYGIFMIMLRPAMG